VANKALESNPHPVDRYLVRDPDNKVEAQAHRDLVLDSLEQLSQTFNDNLNAPPLMLGNELSDGIVIYLYAHSRADNIPDYLKLVAERAKCHVGNGGEFCLDHALGIIDPPFKGAKPKAPGEHKHKRLFLIAFHDFEVAEVYSKQIVSLRNAANFVGLNGYVEKSLDGEYSNWREENRDWLTWVFDMV